MAEKDDAAKPDLDENGKPIVPKKELGEDGGQPSKKDDEPVIPVRRSASFIIERQKEKIEKLRSKLNEDGGDDDQDEDDDELTPEAVGAVGREVQKHVRPLIESLSSKADEDELQELLTRDPDSAEYEKTIRVYMKHPAWKNVPPSAIYHHLAFEAAEATGSKKRNAADFEANQNRGGGTARRPTEGKLPNDIPSKEEQDAMGDKEFDELKDKAVKGDFVKE